MGILYGAINRMRTPLSSIELHTTIYFPLRREGRVAPVEPVVFLVCVLPTIFAHGAAGATSIRSSLRPLFEGHALA